MVEAVVRELARLEMGEELLAQVLALGFAAREVAAGMRTGKLDLLDRLEPDPQAGDERLRVDDRAMIAFEDVLNEQLPVRGVRDVGKMGPCLARARRRT